MAEKWEADVVVISKFRTLKYRTLLSLITFFSFYSFAGNRNDSLLVDTVIKTRDPIQIDFLGSYYEQDGIHSPVTGGKGTEFLTDRSGLVVLNIPLNKKNSIGGNYGIEFYASASTDNINYVISSPSAKDYRSYGSANYTHRDEKGRNIISFNAGGSEEYDVLSLSGGASYNWKSKNGNTTLGGNFMYFHDKFFLFYPVELRIEAKKNGPLVNDSTRQLYNFGFSCSHVLTKKLQAFFAVELVHQEGLNSTPFHRVYFKEQTKPKVEHLPERRTKYPLGLRLNYFVNDWLISRMYYRFYYDDFGVVANTAEIELPLRIFPFLSLFPYYRYHQQTASKYFKPYKEHSINEEYFTCDYDLSGLSSHKYGLGLRISPVYGIFSLKYHKKNLFQLKNYDLRYAQYFRSDGMKAYIISTGLSFTIP